MKSLIIAILLTSSAFGHFRVKEDVIVPRKNANGVIPDGLKLGPCGGLAKGNTPQVFNAGSQITLKWEETINHKGRYQVFFSSDNDQTFTKMAEMIDLQDGLVNRNDPNTYHQYEMNITLPEFNCNNCTIQMIQVMEDNPANPSNYYSCADVTLQNGTGTPPTTLPAPPKPEDCD